MFFFLVYSLSALITSKCNTVTSPQIRILDVATKASETRLIPPRIDYPYYNHISNYNNNQRPLKSYVIYDEYPFKIFKEWRANIPPDLSKTTPHFYKDLTRQPNVELMPDYNYQNEQLISPLPKSGVAYRSVYSNVIKVFDSLEDVDRSRFHSNTWMRPLGNPEWKPYRRPFDHEQGNLHRGPMFEKQQLPNSFPRVFLPNDGFHFSGFNKEVPKPSRFLYPQDGYYDTYTVNYNEENKQDDDDVEVLPGAILNQNAKTRTFLCSIIRLNEKQFPKNGGLCGRTENDSPILPPEYPDYSGLPNDKIPVEHRRQHYQTKRIKESEFQQNRKKRSAGFGYGNWGSPFGYDNGYDGYFNDYYSNRRDYYRNRDRNQANRNRYYGGSRSNYEDYDDDYQNNDDSNSRGLTSYLTNGGRRYQNRKNNNDDSDDDDNNDNDDNNNRDDDSDEEMERQNSGRRGGNDRRNNDNSRDRRRYNNNNSNNNNNYNNNNNNDDDDYRDNRRNNNRQNSRRNNNRKNYNDRYDNNSSRNRYYGNSNGYGYNNGYGSSYGSGRYGSGYGGYGSNGGFGSGYGGYGSSYGGNGYGSGYGGYGGNGFSSF